MGFLVARGRRRDRLETARLAWGLSTPAAQVAAFCMRQDEFVERTRARIARERPRVADALADRYEVFPSAAPFLLLGVGSRDVDAVVGHARERGVAIRDATTFRGLDAHVRVAIRRRRENDRLLEALP
jgi:threonine-phosphate decarboxylase